MRNPVFVGIGTTIFGSGGGVTKLVCVCAGGFGFVEVGFGYVEVVGFGYVDVVRFGYVEVVGFGYVDVIGFGYDGNRTCGCCSYGGSDDCA